MTLPAPIIGPTDTVAPSGPQAREAALRSGSDCGCDWVLIVEGSRPEDLTSLAEAIVPAGSPIEYSAQPPLAAIYSLLCTLDGDP